MRTTQGPYIKGLWSRDDTYRDIRKRRRRTKRWKGARWEARQGRLERSHHATYQGGHEDRTGDGQTAGDGTRQRQRQFTEAPRTRRPNPDDKVYGGWDMIDHLTVDQCAKCRLESIRWRSSRARYMRSGHRHGAQCTRCVRRRGQTRRMKGL